MMRILALGLAGICLLAWVKLRGRAVAVAPLLVCLLSACSGPAKGGVGGAKLPPKIRYIMQVSDLVDKQWRHDLEQGKYYAAFGGMEVGYWVNKKGVVEKMAVVGANRASPDLLRLTQNAIRRTKLPRMPAAVAASLPAKDEGCVRLIYKAYIPPPGQGGTRDAGLTPAERAERDARVQWNKKHTTNQVGYVRFSEAEKLTGLKKETPTSRYGKLVYGRVKRQWHLYAMQSRFRTGGEMDAVFTVNSAGKPVIQETTLKKGCDPGLKDLTLRAIRDAEIPPMPAEVRSALSKMNTDCLKIIFHVDVR